MQECVVTAWEAVRAISVARSFQVCNLKDLMRSDTDLYRRSYFETKIFPKVNK